MSTVAAAFTLTGFPVPGEPLTVSGKSILQRCVRKNTSELARNYHAATKIRTQSSFHFLRRNVGLESIEIRSPKPRFFNVPGLQPVLIREIHDRIFPTIAFSTRDHAKKRRHMGRKWISQKNDALSIYTFATWSESDDVFVSADYDDVIEKRGMLYAPYKIWVARPVKVPTDPKVQILQKRREEIPGHIVILGHILDLQEAEKYLRKQLEDQSEK